MPSIATQLREAVSRYLTGQLRLEDLDRTVGQFLDAADDAPPDTRDLIYDLELSLAEFTAGARTAAELRQAMLPHLQHYFVVEGLPQFVQGSNTMIVTRLTQVQEGATVLDLALGRTGFRREASSSAGRPLTQQPNMSRPWTVPA